MNRSDHCTHTNQTWCDCDWCRYLRHKDAHAAAVQAQTILFANGATFGATADAYDAFYRAALVQKPTTKE